MNAKEKELERHNTAQLEYYTATNEEHKRYLKEHPDKPMTPAEERWLERYQKMTRKYS